MPEADPQDNLHHGPLFRRDWGSAFRAGVPDSSSKSGSPRQPSSRPPFQEGLAGDPLFELECRIPAQPSSRPPFRRDWPGIRFSSWNATARFSGGIGRGSAFRVGNIDDKLSTYPNAPLATRSLVSVVKPFLRDWQGLWVRITPVTTSWNLDRDPLIELECWIPTRKAERIPKTTFITAPFSGGIGRGSAFRAGMPDSSSKSGSPRQPSSRPPFSSSWNARIPARKADPQDNLHHGPLSGGTGRGSAFRAGMPDSSSKSGSPRQPLTRPPFRRDWPGIPLFEWVTSVTSSVPTQKRLWPQDPWSQWSSPFSAIGRGFGFESRR